MTMAAAIAMLPIRMDNESKISFSSVVAMGGIVTITLSQFESELFAHPLLAMIA